MTYAEIAAHYGKATRYVAESAQWGRHTDWPQPIGKRGLSKEFSPAAVEAFVRDHHTRPGAGLKPDQLYTLPEIAQASELAPGTLHGYVSRGRWPAHDSLTADGTKLWLGSTVEKRLRSRRSYTPPAN
ncbi:hypothetical protein ACIQXD_29750 [Streptomyces uncialis]|uniref:hypothetical protein n=1 Tax=Streptomyces uncialis TaxID=1048205 RepID=UPI00380A6D07